jgi:hypothetical protein
MADEIAAQAEAAEPGIKEGEPPKDVEVEILYDRPGRRRGKAPVTIKHGGEVHRHLADLDSEADRKRVATAVATKSPGLDAAQLEAGLLQVVTRQGEPRRAPAPRDQRQQYDFDAGGCLCRVSTTREGGDARVPICNFDAQIVEEVTRDDGAERSLRLGITGTLADGHPLPKADISIEEFLRGDWPVAAWGVQAIVYAGQGNKDHLRAALQIGVEKEKVARRTVFAFTGWKKLGDRWAYLHAGGAIGPDGPVAGVDVDLPPALGGYVLPDPPEGRRLSAAVRAELGMAKGLGPDRVILPVLMGCWRSVLPRPVDFSIHLLGGTGEFKTEIAALAQQHFGAGMDARHLPAGWSSTANALEGLAFAAMDCVLVVDDFAPAGSPADVSRSHKEADRLIRAQGNRAGRQRMRADGGLRPEKPPRGLILSTGEDVPRGHSIRARLLAVEVGPGDVAAGRLTACQHAAAKGRYALAMAAFVCWLASQVEDLRAGLGAEVEGLRAGLAAAGGHRRTPGLMADLLVGAKYYLAFAVAAGAIDQAAADALLARCRVALAGLAAEQAALQEDADAADRYLKLLASTLGSGAAHLVGVNGVMPATAPEACGWKYQEAAGGLQGEWTAQGPCIGWIDDRGTLLDPDASFAAVQKMAGFQGEALPVGPRTLHKRLNDRGMLAKVDTKRQRLTVRITILNARREILHLRPGLVPSVKTTVPTDPNVPMGDIPREKGTVCLDGSEPARENRPTETSHFPGENGQVGPLGRLGQSASDRGPDLGESTNGAWTEVDL